MSSKPIQWIKQYPNRLDDVRLASLHDRVQLRYFQLYLLAGRLNANGSFMQHGKQLTPAEIAYMLRVTDVKQLEKDLKTLKASSLLKVNGHGPFIAEFADEQIDWNHKREGERERKQRERAARTSRRKRASVTRDKSVTGSVVTPLEEEQEEEKNLVVVVVADAFKLYEEMIGRPTAHVKSEIEKLFRKNPDQLAKAIGITADQDKHTLAYLKGVFRNLQAGTQKPEHPARASKTVTKKRLDPKQVKL